MKLFSVEVQAIFVEWKLFWFKLKENAYFWIWNVEDRYIYKLSNLIVQVAEFCNIWWIILVFKFKGNCIFICKFNGMTPKV